MRRSKSAKSLDGEMDLQQRRAEVARDFQALCEDYKYKRGKYAEKKTDTNS